MMKQIVSFRGEDLLQLLDVLEEDFAWYVCFPAHPINAALSACPNTMSVKERQAACPIEQGRLPAP